MIFDYAQNLHYTSKNTVSMSSFSKRLSRLMTSALLSPNILTANNSIGFTNITKTAEPTSADDPDSSSSCFSSARLAVTSPRRKNFLLVLFDFQIVLSDGMNAAMV
ncbi:hypothetical protein T01_4884 [Trichinella spiralis]|uniref:Uncharacterized protein n=1 Tax=Trichinella spiralis TaxID=6334 RepID=A0A0V1B5U9_TRISP|nr:hypothetical protein T01_4884 [Trichinella spiralis]